MSDRTTWSHKHQKLVQIRTKLAADLEQVDSQLKIMDDEAKQINIKEFRDLLRRDIIAGATTITRKKDSPFDEQLPEGVEIHQVIVYMSFSGSHYIDCDHHVIPASKKVDMESYNVGTFSIPDKAVAKDNKIEEKVEAFIADYLIEDIDEKDVIKDYKYKPSGIASGTFKGAETIYVHFGTAWNAFK